MKNTLRQIRISIMIVISITLILIFVCIYGIHDINEIQSKQTDEFLMQMTSQYKKAVENQIQGDLETLEGISRMISASKLDRRAVLQTLKEENRNNRFQRMGLIDKKGIADLEDIDGRSIHQADLSKMPYVKEVLQGKSVLSETIKDSYGDGYINVYAVPIYKEGNVSGALCAVNDALIFRQILDMPALGNGYAIIVDNKGNIVTRSQRDLNQTYTKLTQLKISTSDKKKILADLHKRKSDSFTFTQKGTSYLAHYAPLACNDWSLVSVVKSSVITGSMQKVTHFFVVAAIIMILLMLLLLMYIIRIVQRSRRSLEQLAYFDPLTQAYTKSKFVLEANKLFHQKHAGSFIYLDISNFKDINELFGYASGDAYLKYIAQVLQQQCRKDELYYRDNADCFGLLLQDREEKVLQQRMEQIIDQVTSYRLHPQQHYHIVCHCGIKIIRDDEYAMSMDIISNRALIALKEAKQNPNKNLYVYDSNLKQRQLRSVMIESHMQEALEAGEFEVFLQPKYNIQKQCISGAEALIRWRMQDAFIMPDEFIPLMEKNGFITKLDMYVVEKVCQYLKEWERKGYPQLLVNVNQSRLLFYRTNYLQQLDDILKRYDVDPSLIVLEVTESVAMETTDVLQDVISALHARGFQVSMDDFGSGYSSLNVLQALNFDELKLDRDFFKADKRDVEKQKKIIHKIVELSRELSIRTVAEGVETLDQLKFLESIHCDIAQGFYFSKPIEKAAFEKLLLSDQKGKG